jgi:hypothetical protein
VNFSVGVDEVPFDAHVELLCSLSLFIDNALEDRFDEAGTNYIPLPDEDPYRFAEFLAWAYTGHFTWEKELKKIEWVELCEMWILGDRYQVCLHLQLFDFVEIPVYQCGTVQPRTTSYAYMTYLLFNHTLTHPGPRPPKLRHHPPRPQTHQQPQTEKRYHQPTRRQLCLPLHAAHVVATPRGNRYSRLGYGRR